MRCYPSLTKRVAVPAALTGDLLKAKKSSVNASIDSPFAKGAWCGGFSQLGKVKLMLKC
jgi:hypothetical protein